MISRVRTVSTQGERKSVVIGGGDPVGVFFAWSVLHCRGQRCDAASSSLLVGWWVMDSIWIAQAVRSLTIHLAVGQDDDKKEMKCGKESGVEGSRSHSRLR